MNWKSAKSIILSICLAGVKAAWFLQGIRPLDLLPGLLVKTIRFRGLVMSGITE
jgi:hypothetical protein